MTTLLMLMIEFTLANPHFEYLI